MSVRATNSRHESDKIEGANMILAEVETRNRVLSRVEEQRWMQTALGEEANGRG